MRTPPRFNVIESRSAWQKARHFIMTVRRVEVPNRRRNVEGGDVYADVCRKDNTFGIPRTWKHLFL